ncbi:MAG: tRNA (adenosine(37)-N6)-threonylcarbamoyltransferase complex dimerization subunit type 1 TsaB [Bacteroidetes bacterium]|nr:MAG: tRNA (adenosine(37)-N6)-threonylcarbamoyltransferase complex dimerization subunit type 1 TsaB [Bacteroidota bacterium]
MILCIDTANTIGSVALVTDTHILAEKQNTETASHGIFVQPAIQALLTEQSISWDAVDAVAVANGPGSYTGVRVGLATAKGICFALKKPLILLNSLQIMAYTYYNQMNQEQSHTTIVPMIDARRMEVFTAAYNHLYQELLTPRAVVLTQEFLESWSMPAVFIGNGAAKVAQFLPEASIDASITSTAANMQWLAYQAWEQQNFTSLIDSEPFYCKAFYDTRLAR